MPHQHILGHCDLKFSSGIAIHRTYDGCICDLRLTAGLLTLHTSAVREIGDRNHNAEKRTLLDSIRRK